MDWVSVKDRLPTEEGEYLICFSNDDRSDRILVDSFQYQWRREKISEAEERYYRSEEMSFDPYWNVTHWMPLPAAPKMESGEC